MLNSQAALQTAKAEADLSILRQKNAVAELRGVFDQNKKILDEKDPPRREREQLNYEQESLLRAFDRTYDKNYGPDTEKGRSDREIQKNIKQLASVLAQHGYAKIAETK